MFRVFIVLLLGLSMVCALWVHSHFGGWGVFALFVLIAVLAAALPRIMEALFARLLAAVLRKEGRVLEGAGLVVHEVERIDPRDYLDDVDDLLADDDRRAELQEEYADYLSELPSAASRPSFQAWLADTYRNLRDVTKEHYLLDIAISPLTLHANPWDVESLRVVPVLEAAARAKSVPEGPADTGFLRLWDRWSEDRQAFVPAEDTLFRGNQRLRLHIGVPPGPRNLKLTYNGCYELRGTVELPSPRKKRQARIGRLHIDDEIFVPGPR